MVLITLTEEIPSPDFSPGVLRRLCHASPERHAAHLQLSATVPA